MLTVKVPCRSRNPDNLAIVYFVMLHDIRVGLRLLAANKAFTLTAGLTLALCIGANAALFSVVHHVLLAPLPFLDSRRIVVMGNQYPGAGPVADRGE